MKFPLIEPKAIDLSVPLGELPPLELNSLVDAQEFALRRAVGEWHSDWTYIAAELCQRERQLRAYVTLLAEARGKIAEIEAASQWISVEERPPEDALDAPVLAKLSPQFLERQAAMRRKTWPAEVVSGSMVNRMQRNYTHWKPLDA